ncbi:hypothetical protein D3C72_1846010 [compost metagenome]
MTTVPPLIPLSVVELDWPLAPMTTGKPMLMPFALASFEFGVALLPPATSPFPSVPMLLWSLSPSFPPLLPPSLPPPKLTPPPN